jgi:hypothetical protein
MALYKSAGTVHFNRQSTISHLHSPRSSNDHGLKGISGA